MYLELNNKKYIITIEYKNNKNMYLRVKNDLTIYVTTPKFTSQRQIEKFINNNINYIEKMLIKQENKIEENAGKLLFLGKSYDIIYLNSKDITFGDNKVFVGKNVDLDKYLKKIAKEIFLNRLNILFQKFNNTIPYPGLRVRKMTTRWGVCNSKLKVITLNQELLKFDYDCIDYVIVHELCHFLQLNHSKLFWNEVSKYIPNYKELRKKLKY